MLVILTTTIPYLYEAIALAIYNDIRLVLYFSYEDKTARSRYLLASSNSRMLGFSIRLRLLGFSTRLRLGDL